LFDGSGEIGSEEPIGISLAPTYATSSSVAQQKSDEEVGIAQIAQMLSEGSQQQLYGATVALSNDHVYAHCVDDIMRLLEQTSNGSFPTPIVQDQQISESSLPIPMSSESIDSFDMNYDYDPLSSLESSEDIHFQDLEVDGNLFGSLLCP